MLLLLIRKKFRNETPVFSSEIELQDINTNDELASEDESVKLSLDSEEVENHTTDTLSNGSPLEENTVFSTLSKAEEVTRAFENLPIDIPSSDLIDAETYSIHGQSDQSSRLNVEEKTAANPLSYANILSEKSAEVETSTVETSPLIPDWAKQTENPAFYHNLDIPTFLRRRGSNRPRQ